MTSNKKHLKGKTYKKPNIEHLIVQLNTRGHIHKDKKKEIPRKDKYKKQDKERNDE